MTEKTINNIVWWIPFKKLIYNKIFFILFKNIFINILHLMVQMLIYGHLKLSLLQFVFQLFLLYTTHSFLRYVDMHNKNSPFDLSFYRVRLMRHLVPSSSPSFHMVSLGVHLYILLKPQTFMNLSGESAIYISKFFNVSVEDIFVIYDDMDLPFGTFKIKKGGSSGGHNGIKSLIAQLQSEDFFRIRIGIGRPSFGKKVNDYVLSSFSKSEREIIDNDISDKVIEAVKVVFFESPIIAQNRFNKRINKE